MKDSPGYLTQLDVARMLHVSVRTVKRWRAERTGPPYYRRKRHCWYLAAEVHAWVREFRIDPQAPRSRRVLKAVE